MMEYPNENHARTCNWSVRDLYPLLADITARGESRWVCDKLAVMLTPLEVDAGDASYGDAPALLRIFDDARVQEHIENSANTTLDDLARMAQETHQQPGGAVRFAVRNTDATLLGVVNCLEIADEILEWNPALMTRLLDGGKFCGEMAYYNVAGSAKKRLVWLRKGIGNLLAEETRQQWLRQIGSAQFRADYSAFSGAIETVTAQLGMISPARQPDSGGKAVLCSQFALGYAVLVNLLADLAAQYQVTNEQMRLVLFSDAHNRASLRMLLPFGARLEGFCDVPNPDGTRRARVLLTQPVSGIAAFLAYYDEFAELD